MNLYRLLLAALVVIALTAATAEQALANGDIKKVKHIIIVMQENHSFDNYFGALAYAPGTPYHTSSNGCSKNDHNCVDGLSCRVDAAGNRPASTRISTTMGARSLRSMMAGAARLPIWTIPGRAHINRRIS